MSGPIIEVAAGLVFRAGRLLLTQRRPGDHLGGLWEFPGGKREPNETYEACLRRELHEELGIEIDVLEQIDAITHHYPGKSVHLRFFRCRWLEHEPIAHACADFAWITASELDRFEFPAADAPVVLKLKKTPAWWATA